MLLGGEGLKEMSHMIRLGGLLVGFDEKFEKVLPSFISEVGISKYSTRLTSLILWTANPDVRIDSLSSGGWRLQEQNGARDKKTAMKYRNSLFKFVCGPA